MFGLAPRARNTRQSKLQPPIAGKDGDALVVGRRVRTHPKGLTGCVRWVGPTHFSDGIWIGVELDTPDGRNDGEVQGSRYFSCTRGHGVFVRPDHCVALKIGTPNGVPSTPTAKHHRPRMNSGSFVGEKTGLSRTNSRASLASEGGNANAWPGSGGGSEGRRASGGLQKFGGAAQGGEAEDHAMLERLLRSEAFSRAVDVSVSERVKSEVEHKERQARNDQQAMAVRVGQLEQMVDDCGGAMDDIAAMIQNIHDKVSSNGVGADGDLRDNAGGPGGSGTISNGGGNAGGDAGGGGRDDARVGYLTHLLSNVHIMSTQAADLLRAERKEKNARIDYLSNKVRVLEEAAANRPTSTAVVPGTGLGVGHLSKAPAEPMEG